MPTFVKQIFIFHMPRRHANTTNAVLQSLVLRTLTLARPLFTRLTALHLLDRVSGVV